VPILLTIVEANASKKGIFREERDGILSFLGKRPAALPVTGLRLRSLACVVALSGTFVLVPLSARSAGLWPDGPSRGACASPEDRAPLLSDAPERATVLDLLWIGRSALEEEGGESARARVEEPEIGVGRIVQIRRGDTFLQLLGRQGVSQREAMDWYLSSQKVFNLSRIAPGRDLTLNFDAHGKLSGVEYEIDQATIFLAEKREDGIVVARRDEVPSHREVRGVAGLVETSVVVDSLEAGVPARVVSQLAGIFEGEIDFRRLQPGDAFRVLYEVRIDEDGVEIEDRSQLLAAEVETSRKSVTVLRARGPGGVKTYVDLDGRALRGERASQLGLPVEYTRISSKFSRNRLHPKTRKRRPHLGVDFAAPHGTPVRAVADGRVKFAKWHGGLGRTVRIDHGADFQYDSMYGHLTRYAEGMKSGTQVKRGQVIGYVGSTGLSTGPHLHFSLVEGKRYIDPLTELRQVRRKKPVQLSGRAFEQAKTQLVGALDALGEGGSEALVLDAFDL
jgi:murein DD-endopeptidase MepM/ murein hydrolase activator NlpD